MAPVHSDGSPCREGKSSAPKGYVPCCAAFAGHLATCEFDVRYEWHPRQRHWVIAIPDVAGGGGVQITYCPHCGSRLGKAR